jgi:hypothetical protein
MPLLKIIFETVTLKMISFPKKLVRYNNLFFVHNIKDEFRYRTRLW